MDIRKHAPSTRKVRRDLVGGKRGNGNQSKKAIRRPDPRNIRVGPSDPSLTAVAGLVGFGSFLREQGFDQTLRKLFGNLKSRTLSTYPMETQLRLLIDAFVIGEQRIFGIEGLAVDPLLVTLAGGMLPSIDTVYRDVCRFDDNCSQRLTTLMIAEGLAPVRSPARLSSR